MTLAGEIRIAVASGYHASQGGGIEMTTGELVAALRARGLDVEWLAMGAPAPPDLGNVALAGSDFVYQKTGVPLPLPYPWSLSRLWRAVRRAHVVVVAEVNFIIPALAFAMAKIQRKPVLLVQHVGAPSTISPFARAVMNAGEYLVVTPAVRSAEALVCVSPTVMTYYRDRRTDSITIGHSLDTDLFRPVESQNERAAIRRRLGLPAEGKVACFVGRLTASKGIEILRHVALARPEWTYIVAGDGPVDVRSWDLANVVPIGHVTREHVAEIYRASDALLLPSGYESFGLVIREALASSVRVLCSEQIIDTDPALAPFLETTDVDLHRPEETAGRFAALLERDEEPNLAAAREHVVSECSAETIHDRYVAILANLARGRSVT